MISRSCSIVFNTLLMLAMVLTAALVPSTIQAQDYSEEEYAFYHSVDTETDPVKKTDMLVRFFKEYPESSLRSYLTASFQRLINDLYQKQQWSQVISLGKKFLAVVPGDSVTIQSMAYAYSATDDQENFIAFATKVYEAQPNKDLAYSLAVAFLQTKNDSQFLKWGDRVLDSSPGNIIILSQMLPRTSGARQEKYAKMALKALPDTSKPAGMTDQAWKKTVDNAYAMSYGVLGGSAYEERDYTAAIRDLTKAVQYNKKNGTAYYYLGLSYWQMTQLDEAMLNFAKSYVLKGSTAAQSKGYLEQIWKDTHRGSLNGVESIIRQAQQDLR